MFQPFKLSTAFKYAKSTDSDHLSNLLSKHPELIHSKKRGRSLLHVAVTHLNKEMLLMLVMRGADINVKDDAERTPLMLAIELKAEDVALQLLDLQADHLMKDRNNMSCFQLACLHGCVNVASALLSKGMNIDEKDGEGNSPLLLALMSDRVGCLQTAMFLLDKNADLSIKNKVFAIFFD